MCNCSIWHLKHLLCNACSTRHRFFGYVTPKAINRLCSSSSVHQRFLSLGLVLLEPAAYSAGDCFCTERKRRHHFQIITARPLTFSQLGSGATGTSCGGYFTITCSADSVVVPAACCVIELFPVTH